MITLTRTFRRVIGRGGAAPVPAARATAQRGGALETPPIDIAPNDPILAYFHAGSGAVAIDDLHLDSPAVAALRDAGVKLVVPLISQGELIGLLNLGRRLSDQDYSTDDRRLLEKLAAQASPAVRVAQLVREQEAEVRARERIEQELRVAQLIQQQFLPKTLPDLPGWQIAAFYRAAAEVGGDFYDFIELPDGKVGLVVGDVTGHGVPAALVMATTRSVLRSEAPRLVAPGKVLERVNEFLHDDIPANMFVTCLYAVLDPATGALTFANAGHDLPFVRRDDTVEELVDVYRAIRDGEHPDWAEYRAAMVADRRLVVRLRVAADLVDAALLAAAGVLAVDFGAVALGASGFCAAGSGAMIGTGAVGSGGCAGAGSGGAADAARPDSTFG